MADVLNTAWPADNEVVDKATLRDVWAQINAAFVSGGAVLSDDGVVARGAGALDFSGGTTGYVWTVQADGSVSFAAPVAGSGAVDSVNGLTGAVVLAAGNIGSTPTGAVAATNVQAAIAELEAEKATVAQGALADTALQPGDVPDWTQDQGATNIHAGNIPDLSVTYATAAQGTLAASALQPTDLASGTITARTGAVDLSGGTDGHVFTVQPDGSVAFEVLPAGSGGDVSKSGTPADNQLALWASDGVIEGKPSFTWNEATGELVLHNPNAIADNNLLANVKFRGLDSLGNVTDFVRIKTEIAVDADGLESARLFFLMPLLDSGGNEVELLKLGPDTDMVLKSFKADGASGPSIILQRESGSPSTSDHIGQLVLRGKNDAAEDIDYVTLKCLTEGITDGNENGTFEIYRKKNGVDTKVVSIGPSGTTIDGFSAGGASGLVDIGMADAAAAAGVAAPVADGVAEDHVVLQAIINHCELFGLRLHWELKDYRIGAALLVGEFGVTAWAAPPGMRIIGNIDGPLVRTWGTGTHVTYDSINKKWTRVGAAPVAVHVCRPQLDNVTFKQEHQFGLCCNIYNAFPQSYFHQCNFQSSMGGLFILQGFECNLDGSAFEGDHFIVHTLEAGHYPQGIGLYIGGHTTGTDVAISGYGRAFLAGGNGVFLQGRWETNGIGATFGANSQTDPDPLKAVGNLSPDKEPFGESSLPLVNSKIVGSVESNNINTMWCGCDNVDVDISFSSGSNGPRFAADLPAPAPNGRYGIYAADNFNGVTAEFDPTGLGDYLISAFYLAAFDQPPNFIRNAGGTISIVWDSSRDFVAKDGFTLQNTSGSPVTYTVPAGLFPGQQVVGEQASTGVITVAAAAYDFSGYAGWTDAGSGRWTHAAVGTGPVSLELDTVDQGAMAASTAAVEAGADGTWFWASDVLHVKSGTGPPGGTWNSVRFDIGRINGPTVTTGPNQRLHARAEIDGTIATWLEGGAVAGGSGDAAPTTVEVTGAATLTTGQLAANNVDVHAGANDTVFTVPISTIGTWILRAYGQDGTPRTGCTVAANGGGTVNALSSVPIKPGGTVVVSTAVSSATPAAVAGGDVIMPFKTRGAATVTVADHGEVIVITGTQTFGAANTYPDGFEVSFLALGVELLDGPVSDYTITAPGAVSVFGSAGTALLVVGSDGASDLAAA